MTGLTMTDCSVADNVTQARYEWDRAAVSPESVQGYFYAAWALKWGASLLEVAAEHANEEDTSLALEDALEEVEDISDDLSSAQADLREKTDAIRAAIDKLESCL